jgi:hypothetical protein
MSRKPSGLPFPDVVDLVLAGAPEIENRIEKVYEWRRERGAAVAKWVLGIAVFLAAGTVVSYLVAAPESSFWLPLIALVFALVTGVFGLLLLVELRSLESEYLAALELAARLRRVPKALACGFRRPKV